MNKNVFLCHLWEVTSWNKQFFMKINIPSFPLILFDWMDYFKKRNKSMSPQSPSSRRAKKIEYSISSQNVFLWKLKNPFFKQILYTIWHWQEKIISKAVFGFSINKRNRKDGAYSLLKVIVLITLKKTLIKMFE